GQRTSWIFEKQSPCSRRAYPVPLPIHPIRGACMGSTVRTWNTGIFAATLSDSTRTPKDLTCAPFGVRSKEALILVATTPTCTAFFYFIIIIIIIYISISTRDGPTYIHRSRQCQVKNKPPVALVGV